MDSKDKIYIVNPNYNMINDTKRILLIYRYSIINSSPVYYDADVNFFSFIHPEHAKIFSLFDGKKCLSEISAKVAKKLHISKERAENLLQSFIENVKSLMVNYRSIKFVFPPNLLVPLKKDVPVFTYSADDFDCSMTDFKEQRLINSPLDIIFMVNTICNVDCIYCYADCRRKMDCQIPVSVLDKLIDDCRKNNVRSLDLMGGEVLKYKHWKWLVSKMIRSGYMPYISTKIPVEKDVVEDLYSLGIRTFQISLDSFDKSILEQHLSITTGSGYVAKMKKTLKYFEDIDIKLNIHAVVTRYNMHLSHWEKYLDELKKYRNIANVKLTIVGNSLYKKGFQDHKLTRKEAELLLQFISKKNEMKAYPFILNLSVGTTEDGYIDPVKVKEKKYRQRGACTANVRQIFILPTGEITICEQLMFNPRFILGSLMEDDLESIWKKNKLKVLSSKTLYHNSPCGKCNNFTNCKDANSNGVCWKEILHAYGEAKWNYPDPKCPYAPGNIYPFYIK